MSQEQEAQLKDEVESLEEDVKELTKVKVEYDDTKARLLESEADIDDLRQQLDAALGAEDMIEELTERNMTLTEQIEQLRVTVEDLESIQELNDELEQNHIGNEKELQEMIDYKESVISEQRRNAEKLEETLEDREYTIERFRELITDMHSNLEDMKAAKEITESQSQQLEKRSKGMMDLNRQLQGQATSTRTKAIEMELRRLEAQEAAEHLSIVQLFLPEAFHSERDSVLALLRFKRIGFKAHLLHNFLKERVATMGSDAQADHLLFACDALDKLTWIGAMCERFVNSISGCSLEQFNKYESAMYELDPVEKTLNAYIESLKKEELKEKQVVEGLQRYVNSCSLLSCSMLMSFQVNCRHATSLRAPPSRRSRSLCGRGPDEDSTDAESPRKHSCRSRHHQERNSHQDGSVRRDRRRR